ncbi:MAG TPA: thiamine phosphate synthase [Candidatus Deferrimicrobiaceae bacterium]|jgi:thiamine-phosphate pyrophosphorylase
MRRAGFRLCLVTDRKAAPEGDLLRAVESALDGGLRCVQLREKDLGARALIRLADRMRTLTGRYGATLLVNDRVDIAMAVGADGVHLGAASIPPAEARRLLGPGALIGCSTHSHCELRAAEDGGADFVTFGPVFFTASKAAYGAPVGLSALDAACRATRLPVFALGGIGAAQISETLNAGAYGVALITEVMAAPDPAAAVRNLLLLLTDE